MFLLSQLMEAVHADADLADLRHSHQITKAVNMTISVAMTTGTTTARIEMITAVISSAMLTGTLPTLPVTIVTAGRSTSDFAACTPPATNRPSTTSTTGWMPVTTLALAAKRIAPAVGR